MSFYRTAREKKLLYEPLFKDVEIPIKGEILKADINQNSLNGDIPVYFVKHDEFYDRKNLYGTSKGDYLDNAERFIFFCRSILELCLKAILSLILSTAMSGKQV